MSGTDPALAFWLSYIETEGGLHEDAGDQTLVILPSGVRTTLGLAEEVAVTTDPEVAREDGALLLLPGHPALDQAAGAVLDRGDGGYAWLPWPTTPPPNAATLVERVRERFDIDHGRIDTAGHPAHVYQPVLRVGALVTYDAGLGERFCEREEAWVDARTGLELDGLITDGLRAAPRLLEPDAPHRTLNPDLTLALAGASALTEQRAKTRLEVLAGQTDARLHDELTRTDAYYQAALDSLPKRREQATPDRQQLLDAQAEATRIEHARRRTEITESFRPAHQTRPFRLHLLLAPTIQLDVQVRRGQRAYPFSFTFLLPRTGFAPVRCPHCHAAQPLVAGRERLGCQACLPRTAPAEPTPQPPPTPKPPPRAQALTPTVSTPPPPPTPKPAPRPAHRPRRRPAARPPTKASGTPQAAGRDLERVWKAGANLPVAFWETVATGERWPRKQVVSGSPLTALYRLYGVEGPACAVGIPPGHSQMLTGVTMSTHPAPTTGVHSTWGEVQLADHTSYAYLLSWRLVGGKAVVEEVLPCLVTRPGIPPPHMLGPMVAARLYQDAPDSPAQLDPVARTFMTAGLPHLGLPIIARCLAAWWRLPRRPDPPDPAVLAAALANLILQHADYDKPDSTTAAFGETDRATVANATADLQERLGLSPRQPW